MALARQFEDLEIWQLARIQVAAIYAQSRRSSEADFRRQICRAAVGVMNNIAEGFERQTRKDFGHFLNMAKASCGEVRSMLYAAEDLLLLQTAVADQLRSSAYSLSSKIGAFERRLREPPTSVFEDAAAYGAEVEAVPFHTNSTSPSVTEI